jgi:putative addiction module CopG family antidote
MEITVKPKLKRYVNNKIRSGDFRSPSDVVNFALIRLQQDEKDVHWLKEELKKGIRSLDRGEGMPWDVEKEKARLLRRVARQRRKA